jgi:hypothetical protein
VLAAVALWRFLTALAGRLLPCRLDPPRQAEGRLDQHQLPQEVGVVLLVTGTVLVVQGAI